MNFKKRVFSISLLFLATLIISACSATNVEEEIVTVNDEKKPTEKPEEQERSTDNNKNTGKTSKDELEER